MQNNSVKAETDFGDFELSEEQVNLLLDRVNVAAAAFEQQQQQQQQNINKLEDVKSETLALASSHFVKYRVHDGKHVKTWQCAICKFEFCSFSTFIKDIQNGGAMYFCFKFCFLFVDKLNFFSRALRA